jgi:hypothetical protein
LIKLATSELNLYFSKETTKKIPLKNEKTNHRLKKIFSRHLSNKRHPDYIKISYESIINTKQPNKNGQNTRRNSSQKIHK